MALPLYLAMTGSEILENGLIPKEFGILSRIDGLEKLPTWCPAGGMLVITDEAPLGEGDAKKLERAISDGQFESVLLDFQRPGQPDTQAFARTVAGWKGCPVCVSECYAAELDCPVLLSPVPSDVPVEEYLRPWQGREVWLEAALDGMVITVTGQGAQSKRVLRGEPGEREHFDELLCCHYSMKIGDSVVFTLRRTEEDLRNLLNQAEKLGVTRAVGLYQELGKFMR